MIENVRFTVSSPPRVRTVRPSTEKTSEPVSVPFVWAPSIVMLGRTKLDLVCHICSAPSVQAVKFVRNRRADEVGQSDLKTHRLR